MAKRKRRTFRSISGVFAPREPALARILKGWIACTRTYCRELKEDAPWSYNERASLSTFAAGVWKAKGVALEEYVTEKLDPRGRTKNGRQDLYLTLGTFEAVAEAKFQWTSLFGQPRHLRGHLNRARADAAKSTLVVPKLGLLFVPVYLPKKYAPPSESKIREWVALLKNLTHEMDACAVAWVFPAETRNIRGYGYENSWPGCAVIARYVRRR